MKKQLLTLLLLFAIQIIQAQTHQMGAKYNCKLKKGNGNTEGYPCEACSAKDKKEQAAKIAEDKRRFDVAQKIATAKKEAAEKERLAKLAEAEKNAESGKVYINGNQSVVTANITDKIITSKKNNIQKNYFYNLSSEQNSYHLMYRRDFKNGFLVNGDTIFKNKEFRACYGINMTNNNYNFPPNVGIVVLNQVRIEPPRDGRKVAVNVPISDLVNIKGERVLNDNNITEILHFADDYFILLKGSFSAVTGKFISTEYAEIYNLKTKEKYTLQNTAYYNAAEYGGMVELSMGTNNLCLSYCIKKESLKPEGSYKALLVTNIEYKTKYVVYYINNDSKIERQEITY